MAKRKSFQEFSKAKIDKVVEEVSSTIALEYAQKHFKARTTIGVFVERMQADGAWDQVQGLRIRDLIGKTEAPVAKRGRPTRKKKAKRSGRMTKADKAKLLEAIPAFLAKNPNSKAKDIAEGVGVPKAKLAGPLRVLLKAKKVTKQGKKAGTTYAAGGAKLERKSKPKKKAKKAKKAKAKKAKKAKK